MEKTPPSLLNPAWLPPGTVVGDWRVVGWAGRGVYGAVYQAVPVDTEHAQPVALKVAMHPRDPRFAREVELLSRLRHPNVPRLVDSGEWLHSSGAVYPYIVMEWIEGMPLYDWARQFPPSPQQVLRLLAQLARALQALHAHGAVHRDVKGDNVLVRSSDGHAFLTDFGSGHYPGAATLTPLGMYPGTSVYRAPESWLFELQCSRDSLARYRARPADDLYALGVTACQLLTGEYPKLGEPHKDERGTWHVEAMFPRPALGRVEPPLRDLVLRMLSVRPEERGTAAQLAEALEKAAGHSSEFTAPSKAPSPPPESRAVARASAERASPEAHADSWRPRLSLAAVVLTLATWAWWISPSSSWSECGTPQTTAPSAEHRDAGTSGLGEAATVVSPESSPSNAAQAMVVEDTLPEPLPDQTRPNSKGRCPHKQQVALNGGCWVEIPVESEKCEAISGQIFKGTCYVPIFLPGRGPRPPTSGPTKKK
ncbi:MAG: serine/threonine-protein kinase [Hyalangium sp.]|uniref:serine/threonine-protein kinase n=1 Tax=Hyalangium sp. TaxID=2028555 RepID=UPI00389A81CB